MNRASRTRAELLTEARRRGLPGRSKMTKAELAAALDEGDREGAGRSRRRRLDDRLRSLVDEDVRCPWQSGEGHRCGLPVVRGDSGCALHGGTDHADVAIPLRGRLGVDGWPALLRQMWLAGYDVDPFGLDPVVAEMAWTLLNVLYFEYFRVEVEGIEHVPLEGPALLAANHGGAALPYDGAMLALAVANEAARPRRVRVLGTEIFLMLPVVSHLFRKVGGVYADRSDAARLLSDGRLVGVFPEGEKGFMKPIWEAYRLQPFGRGGFVEVAASVDSPIVPVAILGSEEVHPAVMVSERLATLVRLFFPQQRVERVALFLNPIPLPVRWRIQFLPPVRPAADDAAAVAEEVRASIQTSLDEMLAERTSVF